MEDQAVLRKLQPAYSALEAADFKSAIKHCEKKDVAKSDLALMLKAYALERKAFTETVQRTVGTSDGSLREAREEKMKEALKIAQDVLARVNLANDRVTHLLSLVLRNLGCYKDLVSMYGGMAEAVLDLGYRLDAEEQLFCWKLRTQDFDDMSKLGMKMAKMHKQDEYLGWSAVALVTEAQLLSRKPEGGSESAQKKIGFAEMLLRKLVTSHPIKAKDTSANGQGTDLNGLDEDDPDAVDNSDSSIVFADNVRLLLVQVLLLQGKREDAIKVIDEELKHISAPQRLLMLAEAQVRTLGDAPSTENFQKALGLFQQLLKDHDAEDWRNWSGLIEAADRLAATSDAVNVLELVQTMRSNAEEASGGRVLRGPRLAEIHVHLRQLLRASQAEPSNKSSGQLFDTLASSVISYLEHFDTKPCCFGDLRNVLVCMVPDFSDGIMLQMRPRTWPPASPPDCPVIWHGRELEVTPFEEQLTKKQAKRWPVELFSTFLNEAVRERVLAAVDARFVSQYQVALDDSQAVDARKKALRAAITSLQVARFIGAWESLDESALVQKVDKLVDLYKKTKMLDEGAQGGQREVKVGDDLILIAAHILIDLCNKEPDQEHSSRGKMWLFAAASLLENAYEHSSAGFQLALLMMEIYARLDMIARNCEFFRKLDVKHIQIDSLSYIMVGDAARSGCFQEAKQCCMNIENFWKGCRYQNVSDLRRALNQGNLVHAGEFIRLDQRLLRSHQRVMAVLESTAFDLLGEDFDAWESVRSHLMSEVCPPSAEDPDLKTRVRDLIEDSDGTGLLAQDNEGLASNYDFSVQVSWDCPLGATAANELDRLSKYPSPLKGQARMCTSHLGYDHLWHERASTWMQLRSLQAKFTRQIMFQESSSAVGEDISLFRELLEKLNLVSDEGELRTSLWTATVQAAKIGLGFASKPVEEYEENDAENFSKELESLQALLDQAPMPSDASKAVQIVAEALSQQLLWIGIYLHSFMDKLPKKKHKKNKSPIADDLQKKVKAVVASWLALMTNISTFIKECKVAESDLNSEVCPLKTVSKEELALVASKYEKNRATVTDYLAKQMDGLKSVLKATKY